MEKVMSMVVFGALAVATLLQVTTAQKEHVVGDNIGWVVPPTGASAYSTWASKNTFNVGDTLGTNFYNCLYKGLAIQISEQTHHFLLRKI